MKIYAYRLEQRGPRTVQDLIARLAALALQDRLFGGEGIRLEGSELRGQQLFMDFTGHRTGHGPGRFSRNLPLEDIPMAPGQDFGEDTAAAYHPQSRYLAVQYNHHGPRLSRIMRYLSAFDRSLGGLRALVPGETDEDRSGFSPGAVLKPDAIARLRRFGIVREMEFTISAPGALAEDLQAGRSLRDVLRAPFAEGLEKLEIKMRAGPARNSSLRRQDVLNFARDLLRHPEHVVHASVTGKETENDRTELVELQDEQVMAEVEIPLGPGKRFARDDRWRRLGDTLRAWLDNGALPVH